MAKKLLFFFFLIAVSCIGGTLLYLNQTYPTLPLSTTVSYLIERYTNPRLKLNQEVIGFFPYWQKEQINNIKLHHLSEVNYFSLTPGVNGHILKETQGETEPGWLAWKSESMQTFFAKAQLLQTHTGITIAALNNDTIEQILASKQAQQNLINDIISLVATTKLDRVTIDFEYFGKPDAGYDTAFTQFSRELKQSLQKNHPNVQLSLSLMPLDGRQKNLFQYAKLKTIYDRFIIMSYEYYGAGSDIAGPTAPMQGFKDNTYFFDVETTYEDYKKVLPKEKLIMGVPYYGREWAVEDGKTKKSKTFPSDDPNSYAAVISYARSRESTDLKQNQCQWDTLAQETWCWFADKQTGVDHQLWIADDKSIQTRFTYAKNQRFNGIAIWTLGYDKTYPDLWERIANTFAN